MPARVIVYCRKSASGLTPAAMTEELRDADLITLAEALNLPEGEVAAVREMWKRYRVDAKKGGASLDGVEVHWHATQRPIQIRCGAPIAGELDETLENLPASKSKGAERVREHLRATVEVVDFEMGVDGSNHLAATICEVAAFWVAAQADGIVWFYYREFASPDDRGAALWKTGS